MTAVPAPQSYRLATDGLEKVSVQLMRRPHISAFEWLVEAAAPGPARHPVARTLALGLSPDSRRVLPALGLPGLDRLPDLLTSPLAAEDATVGSYVRRVAALEPQAFAAEVTALWNGRAPRAWQDVVEHPAAWLRSLGQAVTEAWAVGRAHWAASDLLLAREEARVGVAVVTGALDGFVNGIDQRLHATHGVISFDTRCSRGVALGARRLVLAPMLVPAHRVLVGFDDPTVAYLAYPLPGQAGIAVPTAQADGATGDPLVHLLGPVRAGALRALDRPQPMSVLARVLHLAPSTLTYHCDQLHAAGLLHRERHGRAMWISRTDRGRRLMELMS